MICLLLVLFAPAVINAQDTPNKFSCKGRPSGYYADIQTGCQVYHMCDGLGRQFSYSCPNATLFQQRMLICDHWYMVNCNQSEGDYEANLRIGQRDKPFVEESETETVQRTPRPDIITGYRNGRAQFTSNLNLVGSEYDESKNNKSDPNQILYFLPSHWFTQYSANSTKEKPNEKLFDSSQNNVLKRNENGNNKKLDDPYKTKLKVAPKVNTLKRKTEVPREVSTYFRPDSEEDPTTSQPQSAIERLRSNPFLINSALYANSSEQYRKNEQRSAMERLRSNPFLKNSTGFVKNAEITSVNRVNSSKNADANVLNSNLIAHTTPSKPNQNLQSDEYHWKSLRNFFLIPDYEFPLDPVTRPSYDAGHASSFDVASKSRVSRKATY